jgi:hypothetical protein
MLDAFSLLFFYLLMILIAAYKLTLIQFQIYFLNLGFGVWGLGFGVWGTPNPKPQTPNPFL